MRLFKSRSNAELPPTRETLLAVSARLADLAIQDVHHEQRVRQLLGHEDLADELIPDFDANLDSVLISMDTNKRQRAEALRQADDVGSRLARHVLGGPK